MGDQDSYDSLLSHNSSNSGSKEDEKKADLLRYINDSVIGKDAVFTGPFGRRQVIYCDYTASGKSLQFIEDFIEHNVYPFYANTHTTSSVTGLQTSQFREEARSIIHACVNGSSNDHVIFTGSGVTACIHKLIHALSIKGEEAEKTVVIVGPYEHHSNILPWRESGVLTDRVKETFHGKVDLQDLEEKLKKYSGLKKRIIVAMSAASNVTGIKTDTVAVAEMIHKYDGLSIWDYAAGAPYLNIDMNPSENGYKDAVLISPHKFVGGPGTPGVLIAKRHVFQNEIPGNCGGGTVLFVTRETHKYLKNIEEREEGGTPAIIESIRAGLTFQLKQAVSPEYIEAKEDQLVIRAFRAWRHNKNIMMLGSRTASRLPIFSFLIRIQETGKLLHHNFAAALLNDLYGVQARSGCACAGPYAQDLLEMDEETAQKYAWFLSDGSDEPGNNNNNNKMPQLHSLEIMKPGFTRLNLPFFFDDSTIDFVLHAVDMVATHGWKLLPWYRFHSRTGAWRHRDAMEGCRAQSLHNITYSLGKFTLDDDESDVWESGHVDLDEVSRKARMSFKEAEKAAKTFELPGDNMTLPNEWEKFIWFLQPKQALQYLKLPALKLIASNYSPIPFRARERTFARAKGAWKRAVIKAAEQRRAEIAMSEGSEESLQDSNENYEEVSQSSSTNLKTEHPAVTDKKMGKKKTERTRKNHQTKPGKKQKGKPAYKQNHCTIL